EHHHPARCDGCFRPGLGIAAHSWSFLAHHEGAERGKLHRLAMLKTIGDFLKHKPHQRGRPRPRQTDLLIDRLAQISAGHGFSRLSPSPTHGSVKSPFLIPIRSTRLSVSCNLLDEVDNVTPELGLLDARKR